MFLSKKIGGRPSEVWRLCLLVFGRPNKQPRYIWSSSLYPLVPLSFNYVVLADWWLYWNFLSPLEIIVPKLAMWIFFARITLLPRAMGSCLVWEQNAFSFHLIVVSSMLIIISVERISFSFCCIHLVICCRIIHT